MHFLVFGSQLLHTLRLELQPLSQSMGVLYPVPSDLHSARLSPMHVLLLGMHVLHTPLLQPLGHDIGLPKPLPSPQVSTLVPLHFISVHIPTSSLQSAAVAQLMAIMYWPSLVQEDSLVPSQWNVPGVQTPQTPVVSPT